MIRTEWLYYFCAVAQSKSINSAAEQLNISAPAISQTIKNFEKAIDTKLFTRTSKGMYLTPAGMLLFKKAMQVICNLNEMEDCITFLHHIDKKNDLCSQLKQLTIFTTTSITLNIIPAIVASLYEIQPSLDLIVVEKSFQNMVKNVNKDASACCIAFIAQTLLDALLPNYPNLIIKTIDSFPIAVVSKVNSKYAIGKTAFTIEEISLLPRILFMGDMSSSIAFDVALGKQYSPNIKAVADTLPILQLYLDNDVGIVIGIDTALYPFSFSNSQTISTPISADNVPQVSLCFIHNHSMNPTLSTLLYDLIVKSHNHLQYRLAK